MAPRGDFYLRYYVGHKGKFGHEFMEFEFASNGKLRSAAARPLYNSAPSLLTRRDRADRAASVHQV